MTTHANDGEYVPSRDEEFMNERQLAWFRSRLLEWREDILNSAGMTLNELRTANLRDPDANDRASSESDWSRQLRDRDRQRKLLSKISGALARIDSGEYGYCEVTGEEIPIERMIARMTATMTVRAQEVHERREKVSRAA